MYGPADAHTSTDALTSSVIAAGGVPVLLPVVPAEHAALQLRGLDGLVLAGGQDVDPTTYGRAAGGRRRLGAPRPRRARAGAAARRRARSGLPVLGVCRGLQLANVALGGDLIEHVDGHDAGSALRRRSAPVQRRGGHRSWRARRAAASSPSTASTTRWSARSRPACARPPAPRTGCPRRREAVEGPWFVAVQWHPELMGRVPAGRICSTRSCAKALRERPLRRLRIHQRRHDRVRAAAAGTRRVGARRPLSARAGRQGRQRRRRGGAPRERPCASSAPAAMISSASSSAARWRRGRRRLVARA